MIKKLLKSINAIKLRNYFSIRPTYFNISYLEKNISISDGFFWRLDDNFSTIFKFSNLIKLYFNEDSSVEIYFFDNRNNFLNNIELNISTYSSEIKIDKNLVKNKTYGVFYIFHKSNKKLESMIRNSCYVGYSYNGNLHSFVHGNTPSAKTNISEKHAMKKYDLSSSSFMKKKYFVQNSFKNINAEIFLLNSTSSKQKIFINKNVFHLNPGNCEIYKIKEDDIIKIESNCYLLRPIIFEYNKQYMNVYHG